MIPFSILSGNFIFSSADIGSPDLEFRILDLSVDSFTFRIAEAFPPDQLPQSFLLHFYQFETAGFADCLLSDFTLTAFFPDDEESCSEMSDFSVHYRVITDDPTFIRLSGQLQNEYLSYVVMKDSLPPAQLSARMTGYPEADETVFASSWEHQKRELMRSLRPDMGWSRLKLPPLGIVLDSPGLYQRFLALPLQEFLWDYLSQNHLTGHPIAGCLLGMANTAPDSPAAPVIPSGVGGTLRYLYLGNSYCPHLFPDADLLYALILHAGEQGLVPVLVVPPVPEHLLSRFEEMFRELTVKLPKATFSSLEVLINDLGTRALLRSLCEEAGCPDFFRFTRGLLLRNQRKDPRLPYWKSWQQHGSSATSRPFPGTGETFVTSLAGNPASLPLPGAGDFNRITVEACGYPYRLPEVPCDLVLPFYQTNTASRCTLAAFAEHGSRGRQFLMDQCPGYCAHTCFLYPSMLSMVGKGNSLFAFDRRILEDSHYLQHFLSQGVERLLLWFP